MTYFVNHGNNPEALYVIVDLLLHHSGYYKCSLH
jgi:hypothetical protein